MQFLLNSGFKILASVVLSCSLLLTWDGGGREITHFLKPLRPAIKPPTSVWDIIGDDFQLDHKVQYAQVQTEIRRLLADQERLQHILQAAAPYIYFIHEQTKARGLPAELALIPFIESEYNPNDHSNKGALGLWQLMSGTAHELGVKIKSGYDGRRNIVASTKAALAYFNDLGHNFNGNWYLAIAAYNCGEMRVLSAKHRTGSDSFWNLPLPRETKYYVPRLLAVAAIIQDPTKYGVELPKITNQPYFTQVVVKKPVALSTVSKTTGVSMDTLGKLNPDYKKQGAIPKEGTLLVPVTHANVVRANLPDSTVKSA